MNTCVGYCFYSETSYEDFKNDADDPEVWKESYTDWYYNAEQSMKVIAAQGFEVVRIPMVLSDFKLWCSITGNKNDSNGRSSFAAEKARARET